MSAPGDRGWGVPTRQTDVPDAYATISEVARPASEAAKPVELPGVIADRYEVRGELGSGGMASVWEGWDTTLRRPVALKVMRPGPSAAQLTQFQEEARIAAQLSHPGIIPIHDLGLLDDGRAWFAMKRVQGRTLEDLHGLVHRAWRLGRDQDHLSFRRMLDAFLRVCETVAFAHARGVVHRDLKPSNIMIGEFGEVWVVDWGLANVVAPARADLPPVEASTSLGARADIVMGTPAYMAPEQARVETVGMAADVHALGATLYDLLCERPPRLASSVWALMAMVAEGSPIEPPSSHASGPWMHDELDRICMKALAPAPEDRYPDAGAMAADLAAWFDGARDREEAQELVAEADQLARESRHRQARATTLEAQAEQLLAEVSRTAPDEDKEPGWALERQAREGRRQARRMRAEVVQRLRAALMRVPGMPEAQNRLADLFHEQHVALEAEGRHDDAQAVARELEQVDTTHRYRAYLEGGGALTLVTDPPGAEVRLHRLEERHRRQTPVFDRVLGRTPLQEVPVPHGSYVLTLHAPGHEDVTVPVVVDRGESWAAIRPGDSEAHPLVLPRVGELGPHERYVPAGWFWVGDDRFEHTLPLQRLWCDAFSIRRDPVILGEYIDYLNALLHADQSDEAERAAPTMGDANEPFFERNAAGRFVGIRSDLKGGAWNELPRQADIPMVIVTWDQAHAYARWQASRDGLPWQLPMERMWQRAARGADRRLYPWGEHFEPTWCRMALSAGPTTIARVGDHPVDVSVFGVRGQAGNVAEWAGDPVPFPTQDAAPTVVMSDAGATRQRLVLGGTCASGPLTCSTAQRSIVRTTYKLLRLGFRLSRPWGEALSYRRPSTRALK